MLKRGAEAVISSVEWRGRPAVEKLRVPKGYRDPRLDDELRRARIRKEAKLFAEARAAGVPVPVLYDVDLAGHRLVMERIDGPTLKEVLRSPGDHGSLCEEIGRLVAKLHSSGLVHGDLTTSNMLRGNGRVHLIDLSLGEKTDGLEARGVDLRLLKEAFTSAHYDRPELFGAVARAYVEAFPAGAAVLQKMREIEERGRYT